MKGDGRGGRGNRRWFSGDRGGMQQMDVVSVNAQEKDGGKQQRVVARWFRKNDNWDVSTAYPFAYLLAQLTCSPLLALLAHSAALIILLTWSLNHSIACEKVSDLMSQHLAAFWT